MIDLRYKPMWLPQINAPFNYTLDMLDKEEVDYKYMQADPDELIPSQGIVAQDKVSQIDMNNVQPIWISKENKVLDGHHRYVASLSRGIPIKCIKIMLPQKDAIRMLNKIQDIFEYENQEKVLEVVAQDTINSGRNDVDSDVNNPDIIPELEDMNIENLPSSNKKSKKVTGYRNKDIIEKSIVGNFFSLKQDKDYDKYEIEFDNLLNTNDLDINFKSNQNPVSNLASKWFPNIDFNKIAKKNDVSPDSIINRAVAEKARKMGYDGIQYGDIMVQGLN